MTGAAPYKTVITHGFVVDKDGAKISKSSSYQKPMDAEHSSANTEPTWCGCGSRAWIIKTKSLLRGGLTRLGEAYRSFAISSHPSPTCTI
jgi:hypothetical protein